MVISEELQDVPETEIESNWDQVVDKCVLQVFWPLIPLSIGLKITASITWTSSLSSFEASTLTGMFLCQSISQLSSILPLPQF
jgi:hypothetical protein